MPSKTAHSLLLKAFALGILMALPAPAQQAETASIVGQVRIARGGFAPHIEVTLSTRGSIVNQVWTDDEGRFAFYQLATNIYRVIIEEPQYEHYEEEVLVNPSMSRVSFSNPTLTPKKTAQPADSATRPAGSNPYIVDTAAYKKQFPKEVVHEFEQGVKEQEKGKFDKAIRHFQVALSQSPDFYPAHNNLGTIYLAQKNFAGAQQEFEAVLKQNQSDTQAYFNLGNVYLLTSRYADAERVLRAGLQRLPNVALGHFLLGTTLARAGKGPEAEQELRKAQALDPLVANVHLELVNLYLQEHQTEQAIAELHVFLERFPEDPLAPKARELLARLERPAAPGKPEHHFKSSGM